MIAKPLKGTFPTYYDTYVNLVPDHIKRHLTEQLDLYTSFIESIPSEKFDYKYEEDKWTIKQVMLHINDTERVFGYRAFSISRNEQQNLPGFDQEYYINKSNSKNLNEEALLAEFTHLRKANLELFERIQGIQWDIFGTANNFKVPLRLFPFIIAGHVDHHLNILQNKYLV